MILAAGLGKRMGAMSNKTPKALIPIAGKPLILWHLEKLALAGFHRVVINLFHLGSKIEKTIENLAPKSMEICFSREKTLLETAGGIAKALPLVKESTFAVINGDIYTYYDFMELKHRIMDIDRNANISGHLVLVKNPVHNIEGDFSLEKNLVIARGKHHLTFSGISVLKSQMFTKVSTNVPSRLLPLLHEAITKKKITGSFYSGGWFDIGTPQRLNTLETHLMESLK